ncbi:hypothetical protein OESDEN_00464 [Oesophagostomum dentatum]|uniref:Activin types I and II receptor domain protein n=1 Tax=Oesophagostomum dentatum TaxID=61180 RepID=A0A0B1TPQ9_OESDE|nr:hypothetical protein OESDEN_00464 [Oesophagostomum dentatum]
MQRPAFCILLFSIYFIYSCAAAKSSERKLLTCVKCLGNDTACRNTCVGYYCYKYEIEGHAQKPVKRGCLNDTDPLSRVNECTLRESPVGGLIVVENFCICTSDRCNSSSKPFYSALTCLLLMTFFAYIL